MFTGPNPPKTLFFILLLLLSYSFLKAQQRGYFEGYVVTLKGDTLLGQIKDRDTGPFVDVYSKIRFKEEGRWGKKRYGPNEIVGYGIGPQHYRSVPLDEVMELFKMRYYTNFRAPRRFLRVVRESDQLIWYEQEFMDDDNSVPQSYPLFYIPGNNQMVRVTQGIFGLKVKRLSEYFYDCPAMVELMEDENRAINNVAELYDFYHEQCPY